MNTVINCDQLRNGDYWIQWYNNRLDEQITYLMITKLLNINRYILESIHLSTNNYFRYDDPTIFKFWLEWNPEDNK